MEEAAQGVLLYLGVAEVGGGPCVMDWSMDQSIEIDKWADKKFRQDLLTGALQQGEQE